MACRATLAVLFAASLVPATATTAHAQLQLPPAGPAQVARPQAQPHPLPDSTLYVTTASGLEPGGALVALEGGPPFALEPLASTSGGQTLRVFGPLVFVIDTWGGTLTQVDRHSGEPPTVYDLGRGSEPIDVHVTGGVAWVTRRFESRLLRIELSSGRRAESVDLAPLALPGEVLTLGSLERDGDRLFVQVGLALENPERAPRFPDRGVLGVVDLSGETLLDVLPLVHGVQGIALDGAPPHLKMQILDEVRTLYVSTTSSYLDGRGGIERVDLDALASVGYALSEEQVADLGGFVMTSPAGGYFVFHTDLTASTHLMPFTVAGGPGEGPEMIVLFEVIDRLAYDPQRQVVYLPSGFGSFGPSGLFAFSTQNNKPLAASPIDTGVQAHDVVLVGD
jgi:hypothetical protein